LDYVVVLFIGLAVGLLVFGAIEGAKAPKLVPAWVTHCLPAPDNGPGFHCVTRQHMVEETS
jgi:hypothetical protein